MTKQYIWEQLQKGFDLQDRAFLLSAYNQLIGSPPLNTNCSVCWQDAYYLLRYHLKTVGLMKSKLKKYTVLHENVQIMGLYLSHEATDEQVDELYKQYPSVAKEYFEKIKPESKPDSSKEESK